MSRGSDLLPRLCSFVLRPLLATPLCLWAGLLSAGALEAAAQVSLPMPASWLRAEDYRVARIGYRIGTEAARYCPKHVPLSGIQWHHLAEYERRDRPAVIARRQLDRGPGILSIVEGSHAAAAGLKAGDLLLAVNGVKLAAPSTISAQAARRQVVEVLDTAFAAGPARLLIEQEGEERAVTLPAWPGCPARVRLARSRQPTAVVDGGEIVVTTALLQEVRSDDELAVVIGHELAHIVLDHAVRLRAEGVPRGAFREFGRNAARVLATEEEADRLGIRLAAAAGYDVTVAIPFWRRFYARYDGPRLFRTHPSLPARERLIREVLAELEAGAQRPELGEGALGDR